MELRGRRKRRMRGDHWVDTHIAPLDDAEREYLWDWYEMHKHTWQHRWLAPWRSEVAQVCSGGIGRSYVFRCGCGVDFDATDYGSW